MRVIQRLREDLVKLREFGLENDACLSVDLFNIPARPEDRLLEFLHNRSRFFLERRDFRHGSTSIRQIGFLLPGHKLLRRFMRIATTAGNVLSRFKTTLPAYCRPRFEIDDPTTRWTAIASDVLLEGALYAAPIKKLLWRISAGGWHIPPPPQVKMPPGVLYPEPASVLSTEMNSPAEEDSLAYGPHNVKYLKHYANSFRNSQRYNLNPSIRVDWEHALKNHWCVQIPDMVEVSLELLDFIENLRDESEHSGGESASRHSSAKKKTRGRPPHPNHKRDQQIAGAWGSHRYRKFADLAGAFDITERDVKLAVDRQRKRQKKSDSQ